MDQSQTIKTLEMIRRIREAQYEQVKNMTPEERLNFYHNQAQKLYKKFEKRVQKLQQRRQTSQA